MLYLYYYFTTMIYINQKPHIYFKIKTGCFLQHPILRVKTIYFKQLITKLADVLLRIGVVKSETCTSS